MNDGTLARLVESGNVLEVADCDFCGQRFSRPPASGERFCSTHCAGEPAGWMRNWKMGGEWVEIKSNQLVPAADPRRPMQGGKVSPR